MPATATVSCQLELHDAVLITVEFSADRCRPRDQAVGEIVLGLLAVAPKIVDMLYGPATTPVAS